MKNHSKLNNFVAKHSSLIEEFQKSVSIHNKLAALGSMINLENKNKILRANAPKKKTPITRIETPEFVIKNMCKMYEGMQIYNFQKNAQRESKKSQCLKLSHRSIKSANLHNKKAKPVSCNKKFTLAKWHKKFKGGHSIMARTIQNTIHHKINEVPSRCLEKKVKKNQTLKKQVESYKKKAAEQYGIKFNDEQKQSNNETVEQDYELFKEFRQNFVGKAYKKKIEEWPSKQPNLDVPQFLLTKNNQMPKQILNSNLKKHRKMIFFRV